MSILAHYNLIHRHNWFTWVSGLPINRILYKPKITLLYKTRTPSNYVVGIATIHFTAILTVLLMSNLLILLLLLFIVFNCKKFEENISNKMYTHIIALRINEYILFTVCRIHYLFDSILQLTRLFLFIVFIRSCLIYLTVLFSCDCLSLQIRICNFKLCVLLRRWLI